MKANVDERRFAAAIAAFDEQNAADRRSLSVGGVERPFELVQAERLSGWVLRLEPEASEALRLAARCQHIRRWEIARSSFPPGRVGYLQWRKELGRLHADLGEKILREIGYDDVTIAQVRAINLKQGLRSDADVQTMEDALCLSFLEHEFEAFARSHDADKVIDILGKTWKKMSPRARALALELPLDESSLALVQAALAGQAETS